MSITELTSQEASARVLAFLKEDRLIQGMWHRHNGGGRELACLIGSIDPSIQLPEQCPSGVMPQWLAHVTVTLFDGQSKADALAWTARYADLMARWHVLDDAAWKRCEVRFKIACVRSAVASAEPVCHNKDYWPKVTKAAQLVCDALEGKGDLKAAAYAAQAAAAAAAYAAQAAAYAAQAAAYAAAATAATAATAAAYAAQAAAYATTAAAKATAATAAAAAAYAATAAAAKATAAAAAAYAVLASKLLDGIEFEVLAAEGA